MHHRSPDALQHEFDAYLSEPVIDRTSSPFAWWAKHMTKFPSVAAVARTYLCIPATSVASERQCCVIVELTYRRSILIRLDVRFVPTGAARLKGMRLWSVRFGGMRRGVSVNCESTDVIPLCKALQSRRSQARRANLRVTTVVNW